VFETVDDGAAIDLTAVASGGRVTGYHVEERLQWDDGPPPATVTRISFVHRRAGLTRQQFADHWSTVHAPLARRHHPGVARYVQNVVIAPLTPDTPDIDGIAELGFRSMDDLSTRMYDSPEGMAIIRADVEQFIDRDAGWRVVVTNPSSP
jgi:uncharacterized protein (TIGR02118 family)